MIGRTLSITSAAVLIALSGAQAAEVDRGQQVAVALGLPAVRVSGEKRIGKAFWLGIEIAAEQLNRGEDLSLTSVGVRLPVRWYVAKSSEWALSLDGSIGVRRLSGRLRTQGIEPVPTALSLQLEAGTRARWAASDTTGVAAFAAVGTDTVGLVSPQAGAAVDFSVAEAIALGLEASSGRVLAPWSRPAVLGGERALWMPLALLFTLAFSF